MSEDDRIYELCEQHGITELAEMVVGLEAERDELRKQVESLEAEVGTYRLGWGRS